MSTEATTTATATAAAASTGSAEATTAATQATTAATAQTASVPVLGPDGKFNKGWAAQWGGSPELEAKFTDPKALVGSYQSLEKMISAKGIIKPGPNATPQEVDAYYNQLGRPATAKDYALAKPESVTIDGKPVAVPAEIWDQKFADEAAAQFHALGITKEQGSKLNEWFAARTLGAKGNVDAMVQQHHEKAVTALKAEWGSDYAANVKLADDAALHAGMTPEVLKANPHLSNDPLFIKAMAKVGKMIIETPAAGARGNGGNTSNPAQEIAAIYADPKHPWHPANAKANPVAHKAAVLHMQNLYKQKNGEAA